MYLDGAAPENTADLPLGWLGKMTGDRALLEAFSKPPSSRIVAECVLKQRALLAAQQRYERREAERQQRAELELATPMLWIISAGDPEGVRDGLGFAPLKDWPVGFYSAANDWNLRLVVVSQLAVNDPQTVLLRLMGKLPAIRVAVRELFAGQTASVAVALLATKLQRLHLTDAGDPTELEATSEDEAEVLMTMQQDALNYINEMKSTAFAEGEISGIEKGIEKGIVVRPIDADRSALLLIVGSRGISLSDAEQHSINTCQNPAQMREWLKRSATAVTASEIFTPHT